MADVNATRACANVSMTVADVAPIAPVDPIRTRKQTPNSQPTRQPRLRTTTKQEMASPVVVQAEKAETHRPQRSSKSVATTSLSMVLTVAIRSMQARLKRTNRWRSRLRLWQSLTNLEEVLLNQQSHVAPRSNKVNRHQLRQIRQLLKNHRKMERVRRVVVAAVQPLSRQDQVPLTNRTTRALPLLVKELVRVQVVRGLSCLAPYRMTRRIRCRLSDQPKEGEQA